MEWYDETWGACRGEQQGQDTAFRTDDQTAMAHLSWACTEAKCKYVQRIHTYFQNTKDA